MAIESATYINQLDPANPAATDQYADTDNHLRLMKQALKNTFPNITGAINPSHDDLNNLVVDPLGQCRFFYGNATQVKLDRFNGKRLFINGKNEIIPLAGVTLAAATVGVSNALRYVYAFMSGSTMSLEASATTYATDATYGHKIKTGDATRTLVGMLRTDGSGFFFETNTANGVASYFNRRQKRLIIASNVAASSTSYANTAAAVAGLTWADDPVANISLSGQMSNSGTATSQVTLGVDGVVDTGFFACTGASFIAFASVPISLTAPVTPAEGYHTYSAMVAATAGTSGFNINVTADVRN